LKEEHGSSSSLKNSRNIQLLVVGSDDGTVKVFDEAGFLFKQKEKQEDI
jgi:WD40 repeat protein